MKTIIHVSAAILKDHKILLIQRKPDKKYFPNCWTCPGGKVEKAGESLVDALKREVREETGLAFRPTHPFRFYDFFHDDIHNIGHAFLGTYSGTIKAESNESVGFGWFTYAEVKKLPLAHYVGLFIDDLHQHGLL